VILQGIRKVAASTGNEQEGICKEIDPIHSKRRRVPRALVQLAERTSTRLVEDPYHKSRHPASKGLSIHSMGEGSIIRR
jgi:hypothetical protein